MHERHCDSTLQTTLIAAGLSCVIFVGWFLTWHWISKRATPVIAETVPKTETGRLPILDNAKLLLLVAVSVSHTQTYTWPGSDRVETYINPWHVTTFAFISGTLSVKPPSATAFKRMLFRLILANILFCIFVHPVLHPIASREWWPDGFDSVQKIWIDGLFYGQASTNWFLWALIWWHICAAFLHECPWRLRLASSVLLAAIAGYRGEGLFSFCVACPTLPVFIAGQIFPLRKVLEQIPYTWSSCLCGLSVMIAICFLEASPTGLAFMSQIPKHYWAKDQPWFWWENPETVCYTGENWIMWIRSVIFRNALELTKGLIFLCCICPRRESFLTEWGQYSIYPMMLHQYITSQQSLVFEGSHADLTAPYPSNRGLIILAWMAVVAFCFGLTAVLSTKLVRLIFGPILEPVWAEKLVDKFAAFEAELDSPFIEKAQTAPEQQAQPQTKTCRALSREWAPEEWKDPCRSTGCLGAMEQFVDEQMRTASGPLLGDSESDGLITKVNLGCTPGEA
eukprot:TRINITY_DN82566_c0_g1_i1.p1 TRINITY_DN82566_c0_g1~~TRINITY_DN82566_c0_g1_i1.p1  ORF type:complete len:509 (-),score=38.72 TRINITY_DN82566_c0_g1_i1:239-1765(-)